MNDEAKKVDVVEEKAKNFFGSSSKSDVISYLKKYGTQFGKVRADAISIIGLDNYNKSVVYGDTQIKISTDKVKKNRAKNRAAKKSRKMNRRK